MRLFLLGFLLIASPALADSITLQNGSFESGLDGWAVTNPQDITYFQGRNTLLDAGRIDVWTDLRPPIDGHSVLTMATQEGGFFRGGLTYDVRVAQAVTLNAGNVLSGYAAFTDGDFLLQDSASVRVFDEAGNLLATPWFALSGLDGPQPLQDWTLWTWTAPSTGLYTLVLGVGTSGDNNLASRAFYDDITISASEPASGLLLLGAGVWVWRQQIQQRRKRAAA